jgi:CubicO group peptidase (beta-lactamase class C family)
MSFKLTLHSFKEVTEFYIGLFIFYVLLFIPVSGIAQQQDERLSGLDKELEYLMKTFRGTGMAIAIVENDKIIYSNGFGYRDVEKKLPVTPNTLFAIGSITKSFTSASMGILREQGQLDFKDRPSHHIPYLKFFNSEMNEQINISDMMSHRTGLPRHDGAWYGFPTADRDYLTEKLRHLEPAASVREKFLYNNLMYQLLGIILERKIGNTWEEGYKKLLFEPLQMTHSVTNLDDLHKKKEPAIGYELDNKDGFRKMDHFDLKGSIGTAGHIYSNVVDMSNWLIAWMHDGWFNGKQVIPAKFAREAISAQALVGAGLPTPNVPEQFFSAYGYGWRLNSYKGKYHVHHGGHIDGFAASTGFFPSEKVGIVVLTNQDRSPISELVYHVVADRMLNSKTTNWENLYKSVRQNQSARIEKILEEVKKNQRQNTKLHHPIQNYAGKYHHPGYSTFTIIEKNHELFLKGAQRQGKEGWQLKHYHYDTFVAYHPQSDEVIIMRVPPIPFYINFLTNTKGEISSFLINIELELEPLEFKRLQDWIL